MTAGPQPRAPQPRRPCRRWTQGRRSRSGPERCLRGAGRAQEERRARRPQHQPEAHYLRGEHHVRDRRNMGAVPRHGLGGRPGPRLPAGGPWPGHRAA
eukprot:13741589-Alexandrium_andersonii.AAC.1